MVYWQALVAFRFEYSDRLLGRKNREIGPPTGRLSTKILRYDFGLIEVLKRWDVQASAAGGPPIQG